MLSCWAFAPVLSWREEERRKEKSSSVRFALNYQCYCLHPARVQFWLHDDKTGMSGAAVRRTGRRSRRNAAPQRSPACIVTLSPRRNKTVLRLRSHTREETLTCLIFTYCPNISLLSCVMYLWLILFKCVTTCNVNIYCFFLEGFILLYCFGIYP